MTKTDQQTGKTLPPAAERALAEAKARRAAIDARTNDVPPEQGGRGGLDPARYGDWEIKGLTSDF
ncbi:MAG: dihydrodipicolinate reductase [Hyphomicrobiales bacterium]|nr:dihydrodipicolinate reductase [Hyphomicrobiales bacterium]